MRKMTILKIAVAALGAAVVFLPEVVGAQVGVVHRSTRRRTAVVVATVVKTEDSAKVAASQQQAATAQQQAAAAQKDADAAKKEAEAAKQAAAAPPVPAAAGTPLPEGTVVAKLPTGCVATPVSGVEYYSCGGNLYRAAFQGDALVYVTVKPK